MGCACKHSARKKASWVREGQGEEDVKENLAVFLSLHMLVSIRDSQQVKCLPISQLGHCWQYMHATACFKCLLGAGHKLQGMPIPFAATKTRMQLTCTHVVYFHLYFYKVRYVAYSAYIYHVREMFTSHNIISATMLTRNKQLMLLHHPSGVLDPLCRHHVSPHINLLIVVYQHS